MEQFQPWPVEACPKVKMFAFFLCHRQLRPMLNDVCHRVKTFNFLNASLLMVEKLKASSSSVVYDPKHLLLPQEDD